MPSLMLRNHRYSIGLVVLLLATTVTAATAATAVAATDTPAFAFDGNQTVERGDMLDVPVHVAPGGNATVTLLSDNGEYNVSATLVDDNGDGTVTLRWNTVTARMDPMAEAISTRNDSDSVTVDARTAPVGDAAVRGTYDLILASESGDTVDTRTLSVEMREPGLSAKLWTAPQNATFENASAITDAIGDTVTADREPALGDTQIIQINISDFEAIVAARGQEPNQTLIHTLDRKGELGLVFEQTNPDINQYAKTLDVEDRADGISTIYDASAEQMYLVVNTSALRFDAGDTVVAATPGDTFEILVETENAYLVGSEKAVRTVTYTERETSLYPHEARTVTASEATRIYGTSTLAPGTEFDLMVRGPNLLEYERVSVQSNGTFGATFDLGGLDAGDTIRATLSRPGFMFEEEYELQATGALSFPGVSETATSLDGDAHLEDINGDGAGTIFDVVTYYNNRDSEIVQNNPTAFDFDGDGSAGTLFDAVALYNEIA